MKLSFTLKWIAIPVIASCACIHADEVLVNTQLVREIDLDLSERLEIDLKDIFQVYTAPGPVAVFTMNLPKEVGFREMYTTAYPVDQAGSKWEANRSAEASTGAIMAYETLSDSSVQSAYDSPFEIYPEDLVFEEHALPFQLFPQDAPITVANFITYAKGGFYDGTLIHRREKDPVSLLQSGGYRVNPAIGPAWLESIPTLNPISLEAGLPHIIGSLAMARGASENSARTQFFINTGNNADNNLTTDWHENYAVFGQFMGDSMASFETINNALGFDLAVPQLFDLIPFAEANHGIRKVITPVITPYVDISPDNWFFFESVQIPDGNTEGLTYQWTLTPSTNSAFEISIDSEGVMEIVAISSGTAAMTLTASKDGIDPISVEISLVALPPSFLDTFLGLEIQNNWTELSNGLWIELSAYPYIYSFDHGYSYMIPAAGEGTFYLYDLEYPDSPEKDSLGWLYSSSSMYPWIYAYDLNDWLYYFPGTQKTEGARWFWSTNQQEWITDYQPLP